MSGSAAREGLPYEVLNMKEKCEVEKMSKSRAGVWGRGVVAASMLVTMAFPAMASAEEVSLKAGFQTQATRQPSYDAFGSENAIFASSLEVGYASESFLPGVQALLMMQGYEDAGYSNSIFNNGLELSLQGQRVMLGADIGVMLGRYVRPSVRLGVGYSHMKLDMRLMDGTQYRDHAHDVVGFAALGGSAMIPLSIGRKDLTGRTRWKLGLQSHLGYMAQTRAQFDEMEAVNRPEDEVWQRDTLDAGSLPSAGLMFDLGVFIGYRF